jgi:hypothetical protein
MASILFFHIRPDIARAETRDVTLYQVDGVQAWPTIPAGRYAFLEGYCIDTACDCRRVLLSVTSEVGRKVVATISHSFDKPGPRSYVREQTFLDPFNAQSECAPDFLDLFLNRVLDPLYASRLERHYQMAKEAGKDPNHPVHQLLRDAERALHRPKKSKARNRDRRNKRGWR